MPEDSTRQTTKKANNVKSISQAKARKGKSATYGDYVTLVNKLCKGTKRDIFTGDLCYYHRASGEWKPVLSEPMRSALKSVLADKPTYNHTHLDFHVGRMELEAKEELLINIPPWDGVERFPQVAKCLPCHNLSERAVYELLVGWGVKMLARLVRPAEQNEMLLLKGGQGLGKDFLVHQLLGGLGQYINQFIIQKNEADIFQQLSSGLVMHISEFDRLDRTDVATLKNYITLPAATFRAAYARKPTTKTIRCSFIATCNKNRILRDPTGNRRYIIFDLQDIVRDYPRGLSAQYLAEWQHWLSEGFQVSEETLAQVEAYNDAKTPIEFEDEVIADYIYRMQAKLNDVGAKEWWGSSELDTDIFIPMSKVHQTNLNGIKNIVRNSDDPILFKRTKEGRFYTAPKLAPSNENRELEF